jgi:hypothetical protein
LRGGRWRRQVAVRESGGFEDGIRLPRLQGGTPFSQAFATSNFVVAADLRTVFVVLAKSSHRIKPQAGLLGFLTTQQAGKVVVDLVDQFLRQVGRAEWMGVAIIGARCVEHDW